MERLNGLTKIKAMTKKESTWERRVEKWPYKWILLRTTSACLPAFYLRQRLFSQKSCGASKGKPFHVCSLVNNKKSLFSQHDCSLKKPAKTAERTNINDPRRPNSGLGESCSISARTCVPAGPASERWPQPPCESSNSKMSPSDNIYRQMLPFDFWRICCKKKKRKILTFG